MTARRARFRKWQKFWTRVELHAYAEDALREFLVYHTERVADYFWGFVKLEREAYGYASKLLGTMPETACAFDAVDLAGANDVKIQCGSGAEWAKVAP